MAAVFPGDNSNNRRAGRGGSESSVREPSTLNSEFPQQQSKFFLSAWKPVWYTGWHTGVLACAASVSVVLFINVGLTIYVATNREYKAENPEYDERSTGVGTLYRGSCEKSKMIGLWLHLGINALSTLLLAGSNYTQQCLAAPTRSEIDAAHARRKWMDIGVPSVRNLFRIKPERTLLWIVIGLTSILLHLLYNSAVYTSLAANEFAVTVVTNDHFEPGAYSNLTEALTDFILTPPIAMAWGDHRYSNIELFSFILEGYNNSTNSYEDLTPPECTKLYNAEFISSHRNLFLITKHSSNTTHNNTLLDMIGVRGLGIFPSSWMCAYSLAGKNRIYSKSSFTCNPSELTANVANGLPWRVKLTTGEEVEISGCKSERTPEKCKVQLILKIMVIVICCNFVKVCCMVTAITRSREPTLVTLGDAIDSFLRAPDPTTMGICFADRLYIKREWSRGGWRAEPRQWKKKGVQRWWTGVSKVRWITCNLLCWIIIIVAGVSLRLGMGNEGRYWSTDFKSMWVRGFGKANSVSLLNIDFPSGYSMIFFANLPQTILAFLYLTYNSLFTCMLMGHEWSLFSHHHRALRVTSPNPGQRSTYWLQMPYTYAIPLMTLSGLLHWLTSQSLFFSAADLRGPLMRDIPKTFFSVGYSSIAIIIVLTLGILALLTVVGMGYKKFAADITTVGSCSAAISAACHVWTADREDIVTKKVRWGDAGVMSSLGVRHLTLSSEEDVRKPVFGEIYAGRGREQNDRL